MAGVLVASVIVKELISKLSSELWSEVGLLSYFNDDLQYMKTTLESIKAVLNDAEKRSFNDEPVRLWLKRLKAAAYDIEDTFDKFPAHNRLFYFPFMAHKLKVMRERLDKIAEEKNRYNLTEESITNQQVIEGRITFSAVNRADVLGRDGEATEIIDRLLMSTTEDICIIPIVSIGGLGKTTLAKLIFDDGRIEEAFEPRIWVHAVNFEVEKLVEAILSSSEDENSNNLTDLDAKAKKAKKILQGKRYLIVLDDVWSEDMEKWEIFKQVLLGGNRESRIIVTTRKKQVGLIMCAETPHMLKSLSDDVCLKLFEQRAFRSAGARNNHLISIGKEIVKKCQGVPLTANSLGGMLLGKGKAAWEKVKDSDLWKLAEEEGSSSENKIIYFLNLSYQRMPSALKLCFVYCSSYPKGFKLDKNMLIQQWIAQRFIKKGDEALQIGDDYIYYLLSISFLEEETNISRLGRDAEVIYKMDNVVYDFARWVAGDEVSVLDATESGTDNVMECRFASVIQSNVQSKELGKALPQKVRALNFQKCTSLPKGIFSSTKYLIVLDFTSCSLDELPTSIYKLTQLRYLRLPDHLKKVDERIGKLGTLESLIISNRSDIRTLPTTIGKLHNLIYLDLSFSDELLKLPDSIGGLQKLYSLTLYGCDNLESLPESLGDLTELRTLDIRRCTKLEQGKLPKAISNMRHLKIQRDVPVDLLEINTSELELHLIDGPRHVVRHIAAARGINLKKRGESINSLSYQCGNKNGLEVKPMLEALQPHQNLQKLWINGYKGLKFPSWMRSQMEPFLLNLIKVTLKDIRHCEHLPVLGQLPKLEEIVIYSVLQVRRIGEEFCGASNTTGASFPSLKRLKLIYVKQLEEWVTAAMIEEGKRGTSLFPCLEELTIIDCPKLRVHPCIPPSVRRLSLLRNVHLLDFLDVPEMSLLKHLRVEGNLDSFPKSIRCLTSLETLILNGANHLPHFQNATLESPELPSIQRITECSHSLSEST